MKPFKATLEALREPGLRRMPPSGPVRIVSRVLAVLSVACFSFYKNHWEDQHIFPPSAVVSLPSAQSWLVSLKLLGSGGSHFFDASFRQ